MYNLIGEEDLSYCVGCKRMQPTDNFFIGRSWSKYCSSCVARTPGMTNSIYATYGVNHKKDILTKYNLAEDQYEELFNTVGQCQICGRRGRLVVDHDHQCCDSERSCGECVRGVLCRECNIGLSNFADDPLLLIEAANYLSLAEARRAESAYSDMEPPMMEFPADV